LSIAKANAQKALDLSGSQFSDIAIQAKCTLGLAEALTGQSSRGRVLCEEAASEAAKIDNPRYTSESVLFLAEVLLEGGESRKALEKALEAQAVSARFGQQVSEWQALTTAAQAAFREGDKQTARQYASRASELLTALQQRWGEEAYNGFLSRPDIQNHRSRLDKLLVTDR
jgi:ATP/maltotriose-dependent transcriptional regulator MalT